MLILFSEEVNSDKNKKFQFIFIFKEEFVSSLNISKS